MKLRCTETVVKTNSYTMIFSRSCFAAMKVICLVAAAVIVGQLGLSYSSMAYGSSDAKRLYDDLLSNYNRLIRPVGNNSDRLTVKMGLKLSQLIEVVSPVDKSTSRTPPSKGKLIVIHKQTKN